MLKISKILFFLLVIWAGSPAMAQSPSPTKTPGCSAPGPVCAARQAVFVIAAFDPYASAVRIGPDRLVTNRHVVADMTRVEVALPDGRKLEGRVVPSTYEGDLAIVEVKDLPPGPHLVPFGSDFSSPLFTVAADQSRRMVRVYPPGKALAVPASDKPFARLHHSAYSQPGNSGGALLDDRGRLVAIIASGGEGRFDAVPAMEIVRLGEQSGPTHLARAQVLGAALRGCVEQIENLPSNPRRMSEEQSATLHDVCLQSANRPLFDNAARILGMANKRELSISLSGKALERDPNSILSRQTLVTTLFIARRYKQALPHIRRLLKDAPGNPIIQRFAVQAGKWGGDLKLAQRGLALVRKYNPAQAEAAERFLKLDRPAPRPR